MDTTDFNGLMDGKTWALLYSPTAKNHEWAVIPKGMLKYSEILKAYLGLSRLLNEVGEILQTYAEQVDAQMPQQLKPWTEGFDTPPCAHCDESE